MALTFARIIDIPQPGLVYRRFYEITLDDSYPEGGWSISPSDFGMKGIHCLFVVPMAGGFLIEWDVANSTLKAYELAYIEEDIMGPLKEVTDGSDLLDGVVVRCEVVGA